MKDNRGNVGISVAMSHGLHRNGNKTQKQHMEKEGDVPCPI